MNQENASIQEDSYHQNENQSDQHNGTDKNTSSNENMDIVDEVVNTVEKHAEGDIKIEKMLMKMILVIVMRTTLR